MKTWIDIETWERKEHFRFFSAFDQPFFSLTSNVDCTAAYHWCKENKSTFFLYYLHKIMQAVNETKNLKYRIEEGEVYAFDTIHVSPTLFKSNQTFIFSFMEFDKQFTVFEKNGKEVMDNANYIEGMGLSDNTSRLDVIHFSAIPWVSFTAITHATNQPQRDSIPKISVGKMIQNQDKLWLPVSVQAHHGLVDGFHVGQFFQVLEASLA